MSQRKTKKEILTDDLIKQDILYLMEDDDHVPVNIALTIISAMVILPLGLFSLYAWFAFFIPVFLFGISHVVRRAKRKEAENFEFFVTTDKLLYEKEEELRTEPTFYKPTRISCLQFENRGRWEIFGMYYTWSDLYKTTSTGICHTSFEGDIFFLVINKKNNKILMGYNTRFFDYQNF